MKKALLAVTLFAFSVFGADPEWPVDFWGQVEASRARNEEKGLVMGLSQELPVLDTFATLLYFTCGIDFNSFPSGLLIYVY